MSVAKLTKTGQPSNAKKCIECGIEAGLSKKISQLKRAANSKAEGTRKKEDWKKLKDRETAGWKREKMMLSNRQVRDKGSRYEKKRRKIKIQFCQTWQNGGNIVEN